MKVEVKEKRKIIDEMGINYLNFETGETAYYLYETLYLEIKFYNGARDMIEIRAVEMLSIDHEEEKVIDDYDYKIESADVEFNLEENTDLEWFWCFEGGYFTANAVEKKEHIDYCTKDLEKINSVSLKITYSVNGESKEKLIDVDLKEMEIMDW